METKKRYKRLILDSDTAQNVSLGLQTRLVLPLRKVKEFGEVFIWKKPPGNTHDIVLNYTRHHGLYFYTFTHLATRLNYKSGDHLFVAETWRKFDRSNECACYDICQCPPNGKILYKAHTIAPSEDKWESSARMTQAQSRTLLRVVSVSVHWLQDTTLQEMVQCGFRTIEQMREGLGGGEEAGGVWANILRDEFRESWDRRCAKWEFPWSENPPVMSLEVAKLPVV